jgi:hypothetical protein
MPIGALSRIPTSVSRNGTCKSNLRGASPSAPYDYAAPSRTFSVGSSLGSISTSGAGTWSNSIPRAYVLIDPESSATITYPALLSSSKNGTLLLRIYIEPLASPPGLQAIFTNGSGNGYGVYLTYDVNESDPELYEYNVRFSFQETASTGIKLNTSPLVPLTWYQFSIRFNTQTSRPFPTFVTAYQGGTQTVTETQVTGVMSIPSGGTTVMNFFGRLTDFAFLEAQLSNSELAAFGTAPYI